MSRTLASLFITTCMAVCACTSSTPPPGVSSPLSTINVQACKSASLNLQHLTPLNTRGLVNCLNGNNNALGPIKDFIDSMPDADLSVLLTLSNDHILNDEHRLNQTLDVLDRMRTQGSLRALLKDVYVLTQNGVADKFLPVASRFLESERERDGIDPHLMGVERYLLTLINGQLFGPLIIAAADSFGGLSAQALAALISANNQTPVMTSEQIVDLIANQSLSMIDDGSLHALLTHFSDSQANISTALKTLTADEQGALSAMLAFIVEPLANGGNRLERVQKLITAADRPLTCYNQGSLGSRRAENLFGVIARESVARKAGADTTAFYLRTIPVLITATRDACNYPSDLLKNIESDYEIAAHGFADGHRAFFKTILATNRFAEMTSALKSSHLPVFAPALEELAHRGALPYTVQLLAQDVLSADIDATSAALNLMVNNQLQGDGLASWLTLNLDAASSPVLIQKLKMLSPEQQDLIHLSARLVGDEKALRALKNAVALRVLNSSPEQAFAAIARKMLSDTDTRRRELKDLASVLVKAMSDRRGGVGHLLGALAQGTTIAQENPIQSVIAEILGDAALMNQLHPILLGMMRDPKFKAASDFLGRLAGDGELENLIQFFVSVLRSTPAAGLATPASNLVFNKAPPLTSLPVNKYGELSRNDGAGFAQQFRHCLNLHGSLFDFKGQNIYSFLNCTNATLMNPELSAIAERLSQAGELEDAAQFLKNNLLNSPSILGLLAQLQRLFETGEMSKLFKLLTTAVEPPYSLFAWAEPLVASALNDPGIPATMHLAGKVAQLPHVTQAAALALDALNTPPKKTFFSNNSFRLTVKDPDLVRAKIKNWYGSASSQEVENIFQKAKENFETHNDDWKYGEGSYPVLTDQEWKDSVLLFLADLTRSDDLAQFIAALQDIGRNDNVARFLGYAIDQQYTVLQYTRDGRRRVHIETLWDSLEELTQDSNFAYDLVGSVGIGHVGVNFQIAVDESTNLSKTIMLQHAMTQAGATMSDLGGNKTAARGFHNMLQNYEGLQEIANNGDLRIFQRLYRGLYAATPAAYRRKADPVLNHMGALTLLNDFGLFQAMTMGLSSARAQGQFNQIISALIGMTQLIGPQDIEPLRQILLALVSASASGDRRPGDLLISKILNVELNPRGYQELKDALFHLAPFWPRLGLEPTQILKVIPVAIHRPQVWNDLIDKFVQDATLPNGHLLHIGANTGAFSDRQMAYLRKVGSVILGDSRDSGAPITNDFVPTASLFVDGYAKNAPGYSKLWQTAKAYSDDPRVKSLAPYLLMKNILREFQGMNGFGDNAAYLLLDPVRRDQIIHLASQLARNGDLNALAQVFAREINSGDADAALHFVFDNLSVNSLQFNKEAARPAKSAR